LKLVYIVSAYKLPDQLVRLVSRLNTGTAFFLIHVDKKTDEAVFRRMREPLRHLTNVHFLERHRCPYGGFGHVRATLKGIDEIVRRGLPFDYVILLTGQDYPIKTNQHIEEFFSRNEGRSFMEHFPLPSDGWAGGGMDRIESWHVRLGGTHLRIPGAARGTLRRLPPGLRPFGGSSYWCLSRECIEYVETFLSRTPSYTRFFKYVNVPDEHFFHTILLNSPLKDTIVNDDLHYLEWRDPDVAGGPAVLGKNDYDKIMSAGDLFARKFDMTTDSELLDMIDAAIADACMSADLTSPRSHAT
jgi:hypothetical protein